MCERVSSVEPDFDAETKSVRSRSIASSSARIAARMRRVEHVEALDAERAPQHLRREARAAHAEQHDGVEAFVGDGVGERLELVDALAACGAARRASRATSPRRAPVQTVGSRSQIRSMSSLRVRHAAASSPRFARTPSSSSSNESANFCTPFELERLGDVVVVDAGLRELVEQLVRLLDVLASTVSPRTSP